LTTLL